MFFLLLASIALATDKLQNQKSQNNISVGYCYDERMANLHPHPTPHNEKQERITAIYDYLQKREVFKSLQCIPIKEATDDEILLAHSNKVLDGLNKCDEADPSVHSYHDGKIVNGKLTGDTYYTKGTKTAAKLSCGSVVELTRAVCGGEIERGLAICRPPGHHAEKDKQMGFCHLNNVAVAADVAVEEFKKKKIVIFDWDVHHGNGTQKIFWERNDVLYISIHRYENGTFYPGTKDGSEQKVGAGAGKGFNVNMPLPCKGLGNYHYTLAFEQLFIPILDQYKPDLIIISAGFDSARGDPLGQMDVTENGYEYMSSKLMQYAPVVLALEGGYNVNEIPKMFHACAETFVSNKQIIGKDVKMAALQELKKEAEAKLFKNNTELFMESLKNTVKVQSEFWKLPKITDESELELDQLIEKLKTTNLEPGRNPNKKQATEKPENRATIFSLVSVFALLLLNN